MNEIRETFMEAMEYCNKKGLEWEKSLKPIIKEGKFGGYMVRSNGMELATIKPK